MSKLVSLSNDAYSTLARKKKRGESFSDVIVRELGRKSKPDIMQFAGAFRKESRKWDEIAKRLYKERHAAAMRDLE